MAVAFEVARAVVSSLQRRNRKLFGIGFALAAAVSLLSACIPSSDAPGVSSDIANLSSLTVTHSGSQTVGLSPAFDGNVTNYTADVGGAITSVVVKAEVPNSSNTTIRLQLPSGQTSALASGQPSSPIPLDPGPNNIIVTVDAPGLTKAYTIVVNRGTNANLQELIVTVPSAGTPTQLGLTPAFAPATTDYTATTGFSTQAVSITATLADSTSTFTVNGVAATSGVPTANISLNVGSTTIPIVVRAQNGATKTYTVVVSRAGTADLGSLVTSAGAISPAFTPNTLSYSASTGFTTSAATITPTAADTSATITINNQPATSGQAFPVSLNVGANVFTIVVTAQATPPTKTYTLTITRAQPSTNANLSNLTVNPGALSPDFNPATSGYTATVASNVSSIQVTATLADSTASLQINGQSANSGQAVNVGLNSPAPSTTIVQVLVTAQGGAVQGYAITVNRAAPASSNANLASLAVPPATISFNPSTLTYNTSVANTVSAVTVQAVVADANATMTINGQQVASPSNLNVGLNVGANQITIRVTAPAGNFNNYVVNITRGAPPSSDATLSNLVVNPPGGTVPGFTSGNSGPYQVTVPFGTSSATVTATRSNANATVFINGSQTTSRSISLGTGPSTTPVTILVIAQDTSTNKTYTVNINVAAPSSNADLSVLSVSPGTWDKNFSANIQDYTVTVDSTVATVAVTATKADINATMSGSLAAPPGTLSATNIAFPLNSPGTPTPISITVTAQNGSASKTYTVTVTINQAASPPPPPPPPPP